MFYHGGYRDRWGRNCAIRRLEMPHVRSIELIMIEPGGAERGIAVDVILRILLLIKKGE